MRRLLAILIVVMFSASAFAAQPEKSFPFTQAQNQDGAKYVWFIFVNAGYKYDYLPAKDLSKSEHFREVTEPQPGDLALWPGFVAIVKLHNGKLISYLTAENERSIEDIESLYGSPKFYRYVVF